MTATTMKRHPIRQWSQVRFALLVLIPVLAWFVIFMLVPIGQTFWLSFQRFNPLNLDVSRWTGLDNFVDVLNDPRFQRASLNSLVYVIGKVALTIPISIGLAVLLARSRHRQFYIVAFFLPGVMSLLATAVLFRFLYNPNIGAFDQILRFLHLPTSAFIYSPDSALASLIAMDVWKTFGFYTLIALAGVLQIPPSLREAAELDGAGPFRSFWYVTLPLLRRIIALILVMTTIESLQVFSSAFVLSGSTYGPQDSMLVLAGLIYTKGIGSLDLGYAGAASLVLFLVTMIVTLFQLRITRSDVEYT